MPDMKAAMDPSKKGPPDLKSMPYVSFVTQSGWQAATGDYTFADPMIQKQMDSAKSMAADIEKMGDKSGKSAKVEKKKDGPDGAPLLWVHLLAVIAGIGVGFAMPLGKARKFALIGCCAVALLTAGGQAAMGFPITKKMKEDGAKEGMGGLGDMGPGAGKGASAPKLNPDDVFKTVYKFPFFLSIFLTIGALATAAITPNQGGGKSKKPLYDMDEDDEEDDRPRKRRRDQDDDEDEDDQPRSRRKRRDEDDEDEDERPAKKKRRDDDEEEEEPKPRRKAARDEEEEPKPRRKPARDEDEEEEEPKPRREEKPSKGGFGEKGKGGKPPGKSPPAGDEGGGNPFNFG
jgi:hypothetical protein